MGGNTKREITIEVVRALQPGGLVWDSKVPGFAVRCQKKAKVYCVKFRANGRQRWLTIGAHGAVNQNGDSWTPETARKAAKAALGQVASDHDPAAAKEQRKAAPTVATLLEKFLTEHADAKRKASTAVGYRALIAKEITPAIGELKVRDVTRADIAKLHHAMRKTPYQANRALAVLSKAFNLAEMWGERADGSNPCRHVEKYPEHKRERMLSGDELARLGDALAAYKGSPYVPAAIRLLIFTGARLSEILTMKWEWVDFERCEARLPDSKTGAKTLHLPPPAMEALASLPRVENNPFVIVGLRPGACLVNLSKVWFAIRKAAGLDDVRLHDLRHAFASVAASSGMGLPIIGKMLGHSQPQTTARYAHLASDPVKAAAASVAGTIAAAMNGKPSAEVIDLSKHKAS